MVCGIVPTSSTAETTPTSTFTYDTACAGTLGDDETVAGAIHEFIMDDLTVTKTEIWEIEGLVSRVWFDVVNEGGDDVTDFRLMWASTGTKT